MIEAAERATESIPIVILACDRADRLVATIARPGGNVTGMACISSDLAAKRLQLLQEIVPRLSRVAVLYNGGMSGEVEELHDLAATAKTLEIEVQPADVRDASGFAAAFAAIKGSNPQALIALAEPLMFEHIKDIARSLPNSVCRRPTVSESSAMPVDYSAMVRTCRFNSAASAISLTRY
jgi:putative ABC transport system substrate-binding protein